MRVIKQSLLTAIAVLFLGFLSVNAAQTDPPPPPVEMKVISAYSIDGIPPGLRDRIVVEVENLPAAIKQNNINPSDFMLYLDGRALEDLKASPIEPSKPTDTIGKLQFELKRTDKNRAAWTALLGSPKSSTKVVTATVGLPNQPAVTSVAKLTLLIFETWRLVLALILLVVAIILFVWLSKRGYLIHDSNPPEPPAGQLKPYSLGLSQAAFWFFLVIGSFLFIYLVTTDYNTITDQALILMGIGTATALGAAMIDATKRDTSTIDLSALRPEQARLQALINELGAKQSQLQTQITTASAGPTSPEQLALNETTVALQESQAKLVEVTRQIDDAKSRLSKPVSENFLKDLLTDANGITLHRFQIVIWTLVLGFLFILGVYRELAMPEFSGTLLALLGISSGTYLGFKIPERQD